MSAAIAVPRARRLCPVAMLVALLAACNGERPPEAVQEPVVVYASYADKDYLPALFEAYTAASGVVVIVRQGEAAAIVDDVIANEISPPADVLISPTVRGVSRAAETGALRPIYSAVVDERVAPALRDPDGFWTALSYRFAALAYRDGAIADPASVDPISLADPGFRGRLCLSSSAGGMNRTLIAALIGQLGVRDAELVVRGWIANLGRPVFATEGELWAALETGECSIGLVASLAVSRVPESKAGWIRTLDLAPEYVAIEGIGIARHARNPDGALDLVEWLLSQDIQARHAAAVHAHPAIEPFPGSTNVGAAAWLDGDAVKLAERARYP